MSCNRLSKNIAFKPIWVLLLVGAMLFSFAFVTSFESKRKGRDSSTIVVEAKSGAFSRVEAEISSTSKINLDELSNAESSSSQPLLPEDRPDWVAQPDSVAGDIHRIAVGTELASSIEECRSKLDSALLDGVRRYVDQHLSSGRKLASRLNELDAEWIRDHLMDSNTQYAATLDRPAGTYHQLWVQLEIDPDSRKTMTQWLRRLETQSRAGVVGLMVGGCVACLSLLNVGLGFFVKNR